MVARLLPFDQICRLASVLSEIGPHQRGAAVNLPFSVRATLGFHMEDTRAQTFQPRQPIKMG